MSDRPGRFPLEQRRVNHEAGPSAALAPEAIDEERQQRGYRVRASRRPGEDRANNNQGIAQPLVEALHQGAVPRNPQAAGPGAELGPGQGRRDIGKPLSVAEIHKRILINAANTLMDNRLMRADDREGPHVRAARALISAGSEGLAIASIFHEEALGNGNQLAAARFQGVIAAINALRLFRGQP
ncbi:MAG: hypothetical protein C5B53_04145 [Candidatus Melainabacteria bacterium]|nr:MAG: hypothetical protein C5B53_04145 [Candidatus Melainabacteria bacterium]